jgi:hypothetical protein
LFVVEGSGQGLDGIDSRAKRKTFIGGTRAVAIMVQTGHKSEVYAFIVEHGLVRTREPELRWDYVSKSFGERYVIHFAVDPGDPRQLYAVTNDKRVLISTDDGITWAEFGG